MPPPLAELTAQAQSLTAEGDLTGARDVLAPALDPAAADPRQATPDLALAAALQARILIALGDPHAARLWAGFAHAAEDRLHGPGDERTIAAAATHAAVLHRIGNHGRAAQLYHNLVAELITREGPLSPRVLAAEADLATAEHAAGHCTAARARLEDVWTRHREVYGDASAAGIKMLARLGAMERECNRTAQASVHLALAQELCARYLPADHSLAQQIARLAGTPATGRHICGRVQQSNGPAAGNPASGTLTRPTASSADGPPGAPRAGPGGSLVRGPAGAPLAGPGGGLVSSPVDAPLAGPAGGLIGGSAGGPLAGSDAGPHAGREPMAQGGDRPRAAALGESGRGEPYVTQRSSGGLTDGVTRMPATLADAHPVVRQERRHAIPEQRAGSQDRPRDIGDRLAALEGPATAQAGHVAGQRSTGPQDEVAAVPPGVLDDRGMAPDVQAADVQAPNVLAADVPAAESVGPDARVGHMRVPSANPWKNHDPGGHNPTTHSPETHDPETHSPQTHSPESHSPKTRGLETNGPGTNGPGTNGPETSGPQAGAAQQELTPQGAGQQWLDPQRLSSQGPNPQAPNSQAPNPQASGSQAPGPQAPNPQTPNPQTPNPQTSSPQMEGEAGGVRREMGAVDAEVWEFGDVAGEWEHPGLSDQVWEAPVRVEGAGDGGGFGDSTGRHARVEGPVALPLMSPAPAVPEPGVPMPRSEPVVFERPSEAEEPVTAIPAHDWQVGPPGPYPPDYFPAAGYSPDGYPPGPEMPEMGRQPVDRATARVPERAQGVPKREVERGHRQPFIIAGVVVAGIAAAAAVVAVTLPRGDAKEPAVAKPSAPVASAGVPSAPVGEKEPGVVAPANVKLRDNRDSVSLSWGYPKGSEGPVLISGGRTGQERRAFQQLPAGTTEYIVYGLNERNDYCFTVAVIYTVDKVGASAPVCTDRG
ncbi:hypothetical protein GCM10010435_05350 [Winogradskya consettensis]|uniref:Fibronectin type-III domain-containing protein n=1 Tax=Winogradskya consettensis TaxID=113560 RepID=A0A919VYK3_9ACTN|nr:fibronectin type III domain-containing protein [Actinoplanes consettensis]GIM79540.1 hypothetical protein Aco04nite_66020 [Actinoplanes consettensis]